MTRRRHRQLVVDASVGGSAGSTSDHPQSQDCRSFLNEISRQKIRLAMSSPLRQEWKQHQSVFSKTWLARMVSRRLVDNLGNPVDPDLREELTECANKSLRPEQERDAIAGAMLKDAHLLEAALASGKSVIALDEKVRAHLTECVNQIAILSNIVWVNPTCSSETPIKWLRSGAPPETNRKLG